MVIWQENSEIKEDKNYNHKGFNVIFYNRRKFLTFLQTSREVSVIYLSYLIRT